jgi:ATP adenylyltransferase
VYSINQTEKIKGSGKRFQSAMDFDVPIRASDHFICVPSLGSIRPGWVLITPRRRVLNMAQLNANERVDLQEFFQSIWNDVGNSYGEVCAFEHGAQQVGSATGCGVDQAHLHVVPISAEAIKLATSGLVDWTSHPYQLPDLDTRSREYLWLTDSTHSYVAHPFVPVSQFFRRAVADVSGMSDRWDYRIHPFHEHIAETRRVLSGARAPQQTRAA